MADFIDVGEFSEAAPGLPQALSPELSLFQLLEAIRAEKARQVMEAEYNRQTAGRSQGEEAVLANLLAGRQAPAAAPPAVTPQPRPPAAARPPAATPYTPPVHAAYGSPSFMKYMEESDERYNPALQMQLPGAPTGGARNIGQLRDVVKALQGMKGVPPEFAGAIIGKLTGIQDPSMQQVIAGIMLKHKLEAPERAEERELKREIAGGQRDVRREALAEGRYKRLQQMSAALNTTVDPEARKALVALINANAAVLLREIGPEAFGKLLAPGGAAQPTFKWSQR